MLMQGIPGSGKSFIADLLAGATEATVCSTDDLWLDEEGYYNFNKGKLGEKHLLNQKKVALAMSKNDVFIIVDNTNITRNDIKPYLTLAEIFGYQVQVLRVDTALDVCLERNAERPVNRQVPEDTIRAMREDMESLLV